MGGVVAFGLIRVLVTRGALLGIHATLPQKHKKTEKPKPIEAYLSGRLKYAIDATESISPKLPFHFGASKNPAYLAKEAYKLMQTRGARCGVSDCRPRQLIHTIAGRKLLAGCQ